MRNQHNIVSNFMYHSMVYVLVLVILVSQQHQRSYSAIKIDELNLYWIEFLLGQRQRQLLPAQQRRQQQQLPRQRTFSFHYFF